MRRLLTDAPLARCKSLLIHSGQTVAFAAVAVLAAAAAPGVTRETPPPALAAAPVAPPVKAQVEAPGPVMRQIVFSAPVRGYAINSPYGLRKLAIEARARAHKGVDYGASTGTPIRATGDGRIKHRGVMGGYGQTVVVQHNGGIDTLYAHMSRYRSGLRVGSRVSQGQVIGYVGATGLATAPHLHYEFRINGVHKNPVTVALPRATPLQASQVAKWAPQVQLWLAEIEQINARQLAMKNGADLPN